MQRFEISEESEAPNSREELLPGERLPSRINESICELMFGASLESASLPRRMGGREHLLTID
jgi:hypothetical protein